MKMLRTQKKSKLSQTKETFKALVDAIIPENKALIGRQGSVEFSGALKHNIHEYQIWELNHSFAQTVLKMNFNVPLAKPTAKMLNKAAEQLIKNGGNKELVNSNVLHEAGEFAALSPSDRLQAIELLEQLKVNSLTLPVPFWNNQGMVLSAIGTAMMLSTIGYYSGWSGYGSTSLKTPEERTIEHFPMSWNEIGYPGPSKGYHKFRGYLSEKFTE